MAIISPASIPQKPTNSPRPHVQISAQQNHHDRTPDSTRSDDPPLHKLRRPKSIASSFLSFLPRRKLRGDDAPKVKHSKRVSRSSESSGDHIKRERRGSAWDIFATMRSRQPPVAEHNDRSEVLSRTVMGLGHNAENGETPR